MPQSALRAMRSRRDSHLRSVLTILLAAVVLVLGSRTVVAQRSGKIIKPVYYSAFRDLYEGDYRQALKSFEHVEKRAIRTVDARWLDSICYFAMTGEVYYQMGQNEKALERFTWALQLYVKYSDWMLTTDFSGGVRPESSIRDQPTWGKSTRRFRLGVYPETLNYEKVERRLVAVQGKTGVGENSQLYQLDAKELVRCTALAIRRRHELLGPIASIDALTGDVLSKASAGGRNSWSSAWTDLQHGLAEAAAGNDAKAAKLLQRSIVAGGEFDHPLSCISLLELGRIALRQENYKTASKLFAEASYSAFYYANPIVLEEAFRYGHMVHLATGEKGSYKPLKLAEPWARSKRLHAFHARLLVQAAENFAIMGDYRQANSTMDQATRIMGRSSLADSHIGAHLQYVQALVASGQNDRKAADAALEAAMAFQRKSSIRLFHTSLVDQAVAQGKIRQRSALELYDEVLADPSSALWRQQPLEALTLLLNPNQEAISHWYRLALNPNKISGSGGEAIEISDLARRWRFNQTMPLGGRQMSLKWVLGNPTGELSKEATLQGTDLRGRYPQLGKILTEAKQLQDELEKLALLSEDKKVFNAQRKLLEKLAENSTVQQSQIRHIALRREPIEMVFPPRLDLEKLQSQLEPRQAVLAFYAEGKQIDGFLIMQKRFRHWRVSSPQKLKKSLTSLLRGIGNYDGSHQLAHEKLSGEGWKKLAANVTRDLMKDSKVNLGEGIDSLIVVPDGVLWYFPFELLQVGPKKNQQSLAATIQMRYAPMVSLAARQGFRRQGGRSALVVGRVVPDDDKDVIAEAVDKFRQAVPGTSVFKSAPASPSNMLAKTLDSLVVLDEMETEEKGPYYAAPWQFDRGKSGSMLGEWFAPSLGGPQLVVLPGFKTPAENAMRRLGKARPGEDLFLTTCAYMATGCQTMVISRWRTGGRTCQDLLREFVQELPHTSATASWQRSVDLVGQSLIDPSVEPRIKPDREGKETTAKHPFFWSGYLLIDTIGPPRESEKRTDGPPRLEFPGRKR